MAKFLSQVYTVIRGSVGGVTYLAGPHHALIARARVAPVNPGTQYQGMIRSAWAQAATLWQGLSDAERRDWRNYALTVQFQSPTGPYNVEGRGLMTAYHAAKLYFIMRASTPFTVLTAPTTPGALLQPTVTDVVLAAPGVGKKLNMVNNHSGRVLFYAEISPVQSLIRNSYKGPFQAFGYQGSAVVAPGATGTLSFTGLVDAGIYFARVGVITTGVDAPGAVPVKIAQPTIHRFQAMTVV